MDINQIQENMRRDSADTEEIYTRLGSCFPSLLAITDSKGDSSLAALGNLLTRLSEGFSGYQQDEGNFLETFNQKNATLFEELNRKMSALDTINERVSEIRTDSEELEIISLNAMVISIKSGEKGRAFSCITENLKRLSARMISLSNELILDENKLMAKNDDLDKSFSEVLAAQKNALSSTGGESGTDVLPILGEASRSLSSMTEKALSIGGPIREAMSGIQMQDIIRQSIDQIHLALPEIRQVGTLLNDEEKLDQLTLNTELLDICIKITSDVQGNLESSIAAFTGHWNTVHEILDEVEHLRLAFISGYLDPRKSGGNSLPAILDRMNTGFADYISHINLYQRGQNTMVRDSTMIVNEVKHLRVLFDTIRPIIARLQHVRITQQIEVAKNPAIAAVKDTVDYMSELIMKADHRVQDTRKELEAFITDIEELTTSFSAGSEVDHRELERIKLEKTAFFNRMRQFQDELLSTVQHLRVYPDSFQSLCSEIDGLFSKLKSVYSSIQDASRGLDDLQRYYRSLREDTLLATGNADWKIRNDLYRELVERFTITSHKQVVSKIGGIDVETGGLESIESGDVTLFF
jgi:hypothetical protein